MNQMTQEEAYKVIIEFIGNWPSIGKALNEASSTELPPKRLIGIQANKIRKFSMDEAREVFIEWDQRDMRDAAVLRSPQIGLNIRAVIAEKRERAAKEELQARKRAEVAKAQEDNRSLYEMFDGSMMAVMEECLPHHQLMVDGEIARYEYLEIFEKSCDRHGLNRTSRETIPIGNGDE